MNVVANIRIKAHRDPLLQPHGEIEHEYFDYPVGLNASDTMKKLALIADRKIRILQRNGWMVSSVQQLTALISIDLEENDTEE